MAKTMAASIANLASKSYLGKEREKKKKHAGELGIRQ
jgi:hypothetical protein